MKAREIVVLVLVIAAGVFFTHVRTGRLDFDWEDYINLGWNEYTFEETRVIEPPLPPVLEVINAHGSVEIQGTAVDSVTFTFKKRIWRRDEDKARQVAENLHPIVTRDDSTLILSTNREEFRKRNFGTSFHIACPENLEVDVRNSYGLVKVQAVGKSAIRNRHGEVVASDVRGELWLENSYKPVELEKVQSRCRVKSRHADLIARSVNGEMNIENSHGRIELQDIAGKVTISAPHTTISAEDLGGPVEIQNSYEKISLVRVGPADIQARHSAIDANDVRGDLRIRDDYARVKLNGISGNVWVSGKKLAVLGRSIAGEEIYVSSSYEDVELIDFSGKTTVLVSHGKASLAPLPLIAPVEVRCEYSPIILYWPSGREYPLEAQTKNGHIRWKLPGDILIEEQNSLTTVRAFAGLADKPPFFLSTTYSDIRIEEGFPR
ncbi:MAG: hypothetical protein FJY81_02200 [Candidatus Aminicenantes bacterium]|nr:hypothetical protein [Candidatus Aminicenantes bacterium]